MITVAKLQDKLKVKPEIQKILACFNLVNNQDQTNKLIEYTNRQIKNLSDTNFITNNLETVKIRSSSKPSATYEDEAVEEPQKEEYKGMDINDLLEIIGDLNPVKMKSAKNKSSNNGGSGANSYKKTKKKEVNTVKIQSKGSNSEAGQSKSIDKKISHEGLSAEDLIFIEQFEQALITSSIHSVNVMKSKPQLNDAWLNKLKEL